MVEKDESGAGKSDLLLLNTPGLAVFGTTADTPNRGVHNLLPPAVAPRMFAVGGSTLYEIMSDGSSLALGPVANDGKPASFANSNTQLMVAAGGQGYCFTLATNTFTGPIATIAGVAQVEYCDGFFAASIGNSAQWFVSAPGDGTGWDPGDSTIVSVFADNVVSMKTLARYLCFFGAKKSVCYYASGNIFPFDVAGGGFSDQGSAATFGIGQADNTLFGIWGDPLGAGVAFRVVGVTFQRISTHAIESEWQEYSTIADAIFMAYQDKGHTICQWSFPTAGKTWCYNVSTGLWHQRTFFQNGIDLPHRAQFHAYAFGKHLVAGQYSGTIYQMSNPTANGLGGWNFVTDFGNPIRRIRRAPYVGTAGVRNYFSSLELMGDTGLGPNPPLLSGGTAAYDSTFIQSEGGAALNKFSSIVINHSTLNDVYQITGTFKNIGDSNLVVRLFNVQTSTSVSQVIAPGETAAVVLSLTSDQNNSRLNFQLETQNIGDSIACIGYNPTASDTTTGTPIAINSQFLGTWAGQSGAVITLAQNTANPYSSPRGPRLMVRWSDDNGHNFGNERWIDMGQSGQFGLRMMLWGLGSVWGSIGRVFELTFTDPAPLRIVDADLTAFPDMKPQKRLPAELRERA